MTAKEMFEKLEFDWQETNNYIQYEKYRWKHWIFKSKTTICFWKMFKNISFYDDLTFDIDNLLLQAILKQVEELGWNNVKDKR